MFESFARQARVVVERAQDEARALGSSTIEAEHLLLALTYCPDVAPAFDEGGLDHATLVEALDVELATALEAVGVSVGAFGPPEPVPVEGRLRFGTSAKVVMEQALRIAAGRGDRRMLPAHLALGALRPAHGTVPRALAAVGVDVAQLRDRIAATL